MANANLELLAGRVESATLAEVDALAREMSRTMGVTVTRSDLVRKLVGAGLPAVRAEVRRLRGRAA